MVSVHCVGNWFQFIVLKTDKSYSLYLFTRWLQLQFCGCDHVHLLRALVTSTFASKLCTIVHMCLCQDWICKQSFISKSHLHKWSQPFSSVSIWHMRHSGCCKTCISSWQSDTCMHQQSFSTLTDQVGLQASRVANDRQLYTLQNHMLTSVMKHWTCLCFAMRQTRPYTEVTSCTWQFCSKQPIEAIMCKQ